MFCADPGGTWQSLKQWSRLFLNSTLIAKAGFAIGFSRRGISLTLRFLADREGSSDKLFRDRAAPAGFSVLPREVMT